MRSIDNQSKKSITAIIGITTTLLVTILSGLLLYYLYINNMTDITSGGIVQMVIGPICAVTLGYGVFFVMPVFFTIWIFDIVMYCNKKENL